MMIAVCGRRREGVTGIRDDFDPEFGKRLRRAIELEGITQLELAERLGLNKDSISNYVKGRIPRASILYKIAKALGTTVEWLLKGEGEPPDIHDIAFSTRLKETMKAKGVTTDALAQALKMPVNQLCRIVDGYVPDGFTLMMIADRLGVSIPWLLTGTDPRAPSGVIGELTFEDGLRLAQQAIQQAFNSILSQRQSRPDITASYGNGKTLIIETKSKTEAEDLELLCQAGRRLSVAERQQVFAYLASLLDRKVNIQDHDELVDLLASKVYPQGVHESPNNPYRTREPPGPDQEKEASIMEAPQQKPHPSR